VSEQVDINTCAPKAVSSRTFSDFEGYCQVALPPYMGIYGCARAVVCFSLCFSLSVSLLPL